MTMIDRRQHQQQQNLQQHDDKQQPSSLNVAPNSTCVALSQQHGQQLAKQQLQQQCNRAEGLLEAF